jgi:hypothetical protein
MLFDPSALSSAWNQIEFQRRLSNGSETPGNLRRRWEAAFTAISSWVEEGNTLLVTVKQLDAMRLFISREKTISENPNTWEPMVSISLTPKTGNLVQPAPDFAIDFEPFQALFSYQHVLRGEKLIPLYRTSSIYSHRQETAAGFFRRGRGAIVFAPPPSEWDPAYLDAITRLCEQQLPALDDLPEWVDRFQNENERSALDRISVAEKDLIDARERIEQERALVGTLKKNKLLYAGTDTGLVEEVAKAFREFGFAVVEGPYRRADLLICNTLGSCRGERPRRIGERSGC